MLGCHPSPAGKAGDRSVRNEEEEWGVCSSPGNPQLQAGGSDPGSSHLTLSQRSYTVNYSFHICNLSLFTKSFLLALKYNSSILILAITTEIKNCHLFHMVCKCFPYSPPHPLFSPPSYQPFSHELPTTSVFTSSFPFTPLFTLVWHHTSLTPIWHCCCCC